MERKLLSFSLIVVGVFLVLGVLGLYTDALKPVSYEVVDSEGNVVGMAAGGAFQINTESSSRPTSKYGVREIERIDTSSSGTDNGDVEYDNWCEIQISNCEMEAKTTLEVCLDDAIGTYNACVDIVNDYFSVNGGTEEQYENTINDVCTKKFDNSADECQENFEDSTRNCVDICN